MRKRGGRVKGGARLGRILLRNETSSMCESSWGLGLSSPAAGCSGCCGIVESVLGLLETR